MKRVLVTAGATTSPIDKVRAITNVFKGRTGAHIARYFKSIGYYCTLLTSDPNQMSDDERPDNVKRFRTFDDLRSLMAQEVCSGKYDIIIHSAAVSDYHVSQVMVPSENDGLVPIDASTKVSSAHKNLYLELSINPKLVDMIRSEWMFRGQLVKFKLQVGMSDEELIKIACASRDASQADMIVANCLEWCSSYAYVIGQDNVAHKTSRANLPAEIERRL